MVGEPCELTCLQAQNRQARRLECVQIANRMQTVSALGAPALRVETGYDNGHFHNLSILQHVGHCGTIGDRGTREGGAEEWHWRSWTQGDRWTLWRDF